MSSCVSFLRVVTLILISSLSRVAFRGEAEFIGHWEGAMVREGVPLEVSFDFKGGPPPSGTFTSLTQKVMDYPLAAFLAQGHAVHFLLGDSLVFDGRMTASQITGSFTDNSAKGNFRLRRTVAKALPYDAVDVSFHNGLSRSPARCVSHALRAGTRRSYCCRVAEAKLAGAPTALSRTGSPAQGLPHWLMTREGRELPPEIGKCLLTTT
jgi:hypothetical protein